MKSLVTLLLLTVILDPGIAGAEDDPAVVAKTTLVQVGREAPAFTAELLDGGVFDLAAMRGQVVLVNWFATWCPPCKAEMPHLEREVWGRFADDGLVVVSVAREETAEEVAPFVKEYGVTWPFALDPERKAYAKYAEAFIPRNFVIDREGVVVFQSQGFERQEFDAMIAVIAGELGVADPRTTAPLAGHYAAVGTADARYAIESIAARADCTSPQGPYTTTLKMAPWGRLVFRQEAEGREPFEAVLKGDAGAAGGRPLEAVGRWIARGHAFQWMVLEVEDWFTGLEPLGEGDFEGTPCTAWRASDELGDDNRLYFAADGGLMRGFEVPDHLTGEGRVRVVFDRWRTVGGVRLPDRVTATDRSGDFVLDFTEITLNEVDPEVFAAALAQ